MKFNRYLLSIMLALSSNIFAMQIIGHRGACGYAPENTLSSIQMALDLDVDMIEIDVQMCATGELVVIHDDTVDRTTNGYGYVCDLTFDELRSLTIDGYEQIPTLEEVIELIDGQVTLNIELKGSNVAEAVAETIVMYVEEFDWSPYDFVVSSFHRYQLDTFRIFCPDVCTGVLFDGADYEKFIDVALYHDADFIGCSSQLFVPEVMMSQDFIDEAHDNGLQIFVFTINDEDTANMLADMSIDGIFSDYPDMVQQYY